MSQDDNPLARSVMLKAPLDPAADAAAMLMRLGFAIFAIVMPSATLMSRWVIVVLVPIGAILIILSSLLRDEPFRVARRLAGALWSVAGLAALFLVIWATSSLAWAPAPAAAAGKLARTCGVVLLGALAAMALPSKMRASNLHLITIGVVLGALLILASVALEAAGSPLLRFPAATPGRTAVLLTCLGWAAAAWMLIKNRRALAALLVLLVFAAVLLGPASEALIPIGIGFLVLALTWAMPERAGWLLASAGAGLVLFAPLIAGAARSLALALELGASHPVTLLGQWWDVANADPTRLLTGRGFDASALAREASLIPPQAPATLVSDIWYDLGVIGGLWLAIIVFAAFRAVSRLGLEVAPLALAGLASAFTFAIIERGATQTWWLNGMVVFAIVLMSVERGRHRTVRPRASMKTGGAPLAAQPS